MTDHLCEHGFKDYCPICSGDYERIEGYTLTRLYPDAIGIFYFKLHTGEILRSELYLDFAEEVLERLDAEGVFCKKINGNLRTRIDPELYREAYWRVRRIFREHECRESDQEVINNFLKSIDEYFMSRIPATTDDDVPFDSPEYDDEILFRKFDSDKP